MLRASQVAQAAAAAAATFSCFVPRCIVCASLLRLRFAVVAVVFCKSGGLRRWLAGLVVDWNETSFDDGTFMSMMRLIVCPHSPPRKLRFFKGMSKLQKFYCVSKQIEGGKKPRGFKDYYYH
jgi:hypothetical protein